MGARHVLTDKQLDSAKPAAKGSRYILWDAVAPSLGIRITDSGHRSFLVQRRVNGRMIKLTLGEYPALSLAEARTKTRTALEDMAKGLDPRQAMPARVTASGLRADSFEAAVEKYIKREVEKNRRPGTQYQIILRLRKILVPKWGSLPLSSIGPRQIIDVLDEIVDAGTPVAANRTYSALHRFFRWCVERHLIDANPAANVRKPAKEVSRSRVLNDHELWEIWTASQTLGWPFGPLVRGLILTGQRRNELAGMTWGEIDEQSHHWLIPAARSKNAKEHAVPLSPAMLALISAAPRFGDGEEVPPGRPVFTTNGKTNVSGFSRAKTRLDSAILAARRKQTAEAGKPTDKVKALPGWTFHDLRRTCATGMGSIGIAPHIIEAVLNHSSGFRAGVAGIYQRQSYLKECRHALNAWATHITGLTVPREPTANVVSFQRGAR